MHTCKIYTLDSLSRRSMTLEKGATNCYLLHLATANAAHDVSGRQVTRRANGISPDPKTPQILTWLFRLCYLCLADSNICPCMTTWL